MKTRLLRKLRKKAKGRTWLEYSNGCYYVFNKVGKYTVSILPTIETPLVALRELNNLRRRVILEWVEEMKEELKEKKINREIRHL